jgi:hypothetical protein
MLPICLFEVTGPASLALNFFEDTGPASLALNLNIKPNINTNTDEFRHL